MEYTRQEIESALAAGNLWAVIRKGRYWRLRRNGATKTWKRDPERYSIPVKAGFKSCARIENDDPDGWWLISEDDPNK